MADDSSKTVSRSPGTLWRVLHRIFGVSRPYRVRLYTALVLTVTSSLVWLVVPMGLRAMLDAVFEKANHGLLNEIALLLVILFLFQTVLSFVGHYLLQWTGERVVTDLRQRLYSHLHSLDLKFFSNQRTGDLTSRLTNDVASVRAAVTTSLVEMINQSLTLVGSVVLMVVLNWRLSSIIFLMIPGATLLSRYFGIKVRKLARNIQDKLADTTAIAEEALGAVRIVKAFARENYETNRYSASIESLFREAKHNVLVSNLYWTSIGFLFFSALIGIFWFGGREVLADRLTAGDLVAFIFYAFSISTSVGGLSRLYTTFNSAAGATERLFELLDIEPEIRDLPGAIAVSRINGRVDFEDVIFGYVEGLPVLFDIDISVEPGRTIALVGPSGSGKTTLLNLIPRFYDPVSGSVKIDGFDLKELQSLPLREQIAVVPQEVHLFGGSIKENIRYGRLDATDEEVEAAARAANAHEFIMAMPEGYETTVGERGVKLSGGQRQRLAIARAILKDARILLLDEATSSLDSSSEALVQEALERLMEGRTTFIIAHRLSTVQHADRVIVLDKGRIVQDGTHSDLINEDGIYRTLARLQFRDDHIWEEAFGAPALAGGAPALAVG